MIETQNDEDDAESDELIGTSFVIRISAFVISGNVHAAALMPESWTIGRLLQWTTDYLKQHGADSPRLDAEVLLAHVAGCKRIELYTAFDEPASDDLRTKFRALVKERAEGKPVAYLVGHREFYSMELSRHARRADSAAGDRIAGASAVGHRQRARADASIAIADVGTGSGIIAVVAAKRLPPARVTAIDRSRAAIDVAKKNAKPHGVAERIECVESDLFAAVPADRKFDIIASNPPYVSEAEFAQLSKTVKDFEPHAALVAGPRGTEVIERLIPQAAERLKPGGWLLMEVSPMIEAAARALLEADTRFTVQATVKDLAQQPRVVQGQRK